MKFKFRIKLFYQQKYCSSFISIRYFKCASRLELGIFYFSMDGDLIDYM